MSFTVSYLIGASQRYTTLALWAADAPVNYTTAEQSSAGTCAVAAFTQGEALSFVGSGATGKFLGTDSTGVGTGTYIQYSITAGNPAASDVVTGESSTATCILSSSTADFVGCIWQGKINAASDNALSGFTLSGGTCSVTAYAELTTNTGASFRDNANAQTNALRANQSNGCCIYETATYKVGIINSQSYSHFSNLQILCTGSTHTTAIQNHINYDGYYAIIDSCIFDVGGWGGVVSIDYGTIKNSLLIKRIEGIDTNAILSLFTGGGVYNCTLVSTTAIPSGTGIRANYSTATVKNCAIFGVTAVKTGSTTFTFTTCYTDVASPPSGCTTVAYNTSTGSGFQNITDATRDFRIKAGSALLDVGTTDSTNAATDIVGTARPQGSAYDVGCWELVAAAGGVTELQTLLMGVS